jgi:hypothetical protein
MERAAKAVGNVAAGHVGDAEKEVGRCLPASDHVWREAVRGQTSGSRTLAGVRCVLGWTVMRYLRREVRRKAWVGGADQKQVVVGQPC